MDQGANLFLSEFIRALQSPSLRFCLAGFSAYCLHFLFALFLGIPGHTLESSGFLCSQSPESLKVQRLCTDLVISFQSSIDTISQNWFPKIIVTTFYGEGEMRHCGELWTDYLIHMLINKSLLLIKVPESDNESV